MYDRSEVAPFGYSHTATMVVDRSSDRLASVELPTVPVTDHDAEQNKTKYKHRSRQASRHEWFDPGTISEAREDNSTENREKCERGKNARLPCGWRQGQMGCRLSNTRIVPYQCQLIKLFNKYRYSNVMRRSRDARSSGIAIQSITILGPDTTDFDTLSQTRRAKAS